MNKPYFDGLIQMFQSRSAFDASMLRMLEEAAKMGDGEGSKGDAHPRRCRGR